MKLFLQWFGVFWLIITLPVIFFTFTAGEPQGEMWATVLFLAGIAVAPGVWGLYRSREYPERDEWSGEVTDQGSVIGGSVRLVKMILKDPRGFWESVRW